jgi:hypothetical protein
MFHAFNGCLDQRLGQLNLTPEVRQAINDQRINLAAANAPPNADEATRNAVKQVIDECFVAGFRRVLLTGAALAFASSAVAAVVIKPR